MKTLKGPAIFLAQFIGSEPPFDKLETMAKWVADLGYVGVQMPTGGADSFFDLALAADSQTYCDDIAGLLAEYGLEITELSTHLQGQLVAVHPAYDELFDGFAPPELRGKPSERQVWAVGQVKAAAVASRRLGLKAHATFSGALAWPYFYPWPQRPAGLIEEAFAELGRRWKPILDVFERTVSTLVTRSIRARTCTTARPSSGSWMRSAAIRAPISSMIPATSSCSNWTIWATSTAITNGSKPSTSRTPSSGRRPSRASMAATRAGPSGPAGSARWATARWTSRRSSPNWPSTTSTAGRCWSGSAP
jgi:hypothetical protein